MTQNKDKKPGISGQSEKFQKKPIIIYLLFETIKGNYDLLDSLAENLIIKGPKEDIVPKIFNDSICYTKRKSNRLRFKCIRIENIIIGKYEIFIKSYHNNDNKTLLLGNINIDFEKNNNTINVTVDNNSVLWENANKILKGLRLKGRSKFENAVIKPFLIPHIFCNTNKIDNHKEHEIDNLYVFVKSLINKDKIDIYQTDNNGYLVPLQIESEGIETQIIPPIFPVYCFAEDKINLEMCLILYPPVKFNIYSIDFKKHRKTINMNKEINLSILIKYVKNFQDSNYFEVTQKEGDWEKTGLKILIDEWKSFPLGGNVYDNVVLYENMPMCDCLYIQSLIFKLQMHLGLMRYPIGADQVNPYFPRFYYNIFNARQYNSLFDVYTYNSILSLKHNILNATFYKLDSENTFKVYIDTHNNYSPKEKLKRDALSRKKRSIIWDPETDKNNNIHPSQNFKGKEQKVNFPQDETDNYYDLESEIGDILDVYQIKDLKFYHEQLRTIIDRKISSKIEFCLDKGYRKPGHILVANTNNDKNNPWWLWFRDDVLEPFRQWHQNVINKGFDIGVIPSHTFRSTDKDVLYAPVGTAVRSIHKTGCAIDLRHIGATRWPRAEFPVIITYNKQRHSFILYGEFTDKEKNCEKDKIKSFIPDPFDKIGGEEIKLYGCFVNITDEAYSQFFTNIRHFNIRVWSLRDEKPISKADADTLQAIEKEKLYDRNDYRDLKDSAKTMKYWNNIIDNLHQLKKVEVDSFDEFDYMFNNSISDDQSIFVIKNTRGLIFNYNNGQIIYNKINDHTLELYFLVVNIYIYNDLKILHFVDSMISATDTFIYDIKRPLEIQSYLEDDTYSCFIEIVPAVDESKMDKLVKIPGDSIGMEWWHYQYYPAFIYGSEELNENKIKLENNIPVYLFFDETFHLTNISLAMRTIVTQNELDNVDFREINLTNSSDFEGLWSQNKGVLTEHMNNVMGIDISIEKLADSLKIKLSSKLVGVFERDEVKSKIMAKIKPKHHQSIFETIGDDTFKEKLKLELYKRLKSLNRFTAQINIENKELMIKISNEYKSNDYNKRIYWAWSSVAQRSYWWREIVYNCWSSVIFEILYYNVTEYNEKLYARVKDLKEAKGHKLWIELLEEIGWTLDGLKKIGYRASDLIRPSGRDSVKNDFELNK